MNNKPRYMKYGLGFQYGVKFGFWQASVSLTKGIYFTPRK
jgi:hypothetical protein